MTKLGAIMESEIAQTPDIFAKLINTDLFSDELSQILEKNQIQSILILARGTSDNAAHFFKYLVETQLGLPCGLTSPSSVTIYKSKLHYEKTLVVALSQSGMSTDLVEFAKAARSSGAKIVAITNNEQSDLALNSDQHIPLLTGPELAVAATKSYSAQLLISYLLVMKWAGKVPQTEKLVDEARAVLSNRGKITEIAKQIDLKSEIVALGRGFAYPNAKEAALKIQETCKVSVHGLSTADYLHGPISALNESSQVIFLAPCCMPEKSISEALIKIRKISNKIFWIGNVDVVQPGESNLGGSCCSDEITSTIVDSMILQELALQLSVANGFDPDAPAGLSKVTMTI